MKIDFNNRFLIPLPGITSLVRIGNTSFRSSNNIRVSTNKYNLLYMSARIIEYHIIRKLIMKKIKFVLHFLPM